jgi:uncharacterized protein (DUF1800 family)
VSSYRGSFGTAEAERLLWRAGFGPRPGEAATLAKKGLDRAVQSLLHPGAERLSGAAPTDDDGRPIAPYDAWGHDGLWWLDRMVRTNRPLIERMTLVWHDWFATSNDEVGSPRLMLRQNKLLRRLALKSFDTLLVEVTRDPAMLIFLSGVENNRFAPNENYGRELMELFTLGAGRGYSENDVREQARALTGFKAEWSDGLGMHDFHFDPKLHDPGTKRVLGKKGRFDWRDSCRLCVEHNAHPRFFVEKLWSYFVPLTPPARTRSALERLYVSGDYEIEPVVRAILRHPLFYSGPRMVKPPIVLLAGMLRGTGRTVDTDAWTWISGTMGQRLFYPPNVAGWDDARWLDTATWRGRWTAAVTAIGKREVDPESEYGANEDPAAAVEAALDFWGGPTLSPQTRQALLSFSKRCADGADRNWKRNSYPALRQNALRTLIATSPDFQTC